MRLKETKVSWPVGVVIDIVGFGTTLDLVQMHGDFRIALCREQAQQLLPILKHFIKTGRLPDES